MTSPACPSLYNCYVGCGGKRSFQQKMPFFHSSSLVKALERMDGMLVYYAYSMYTIRQHHGHDHEAGSNSRLLPQETWGIWNDLPQFDIHTSRWLWGFKQIGSFSCLFIVFGVLALEF